MDVRERSAGMLIPAQIWAPVVLSSCLLIAGCGHHASKPLITFTRVPPAGEGGPDKLDNIEGRVRGAKPGERIVLYAKAGSIWWIQPLAMQPFTPIESDSTWKTSTHLGSEYAAILVEPGYVPALTLKTLPPTGPEVSSTVSVRVGPGPPTVNQTLQFSGYTWYVRHISSDRNGAISYYDPANAWTAPDGTLHLRISRDGDRWKCSQVTLANHLGYGTYRFQVRDTSEFEPAAALSMFTYDDLASEHHREMDIEISRWGDPKNKNGDYVVQPYSFPENKVIFELPGGTLTHSLRWQAGRATFETFRGVADGATASAYQKSIFATGIPSPGGEAIVIDFCNFKFSKRPLQNEAEAVVEKFQYLP